MMLLRIARVLFSYFNVKRTIWLKVSV